MELVGFEPTLSIMLLPIQPLVLNPRIELGSLLYKSKVLPLNELNMVSEENFEISTPRSQSVCSASELLTDGTLERSRTPKSCFEGKCFIH